MNRILVLVLTLILSLLLTACKHNGVKPDLQSRALADVRDQYFETNKETIRRHIARMSEEQPELALYFVLSDTVLRVAERCEEVCTPLSFAIAEENTNTVITDICQGDSIGQRINRCSRHSDPGDYDSCIRRELAAGVCP